jgi:formamidopyrimidine-DNA glycosylase
MFRRRERFIVPELPEVETVVRDLRPRLVGRKVGAVEVGNKALRKPWDPAWGPLIIGRRIKGVRRRGKWILIDLGQDLVLVVHLGMTGQLTVAPATAERETHTHLILALGRGQLRFRDIRRFGSATLFQSADDLGRFFADSGLGPEPWDLKAEQWHQRLALTRRCLKAVLLDQRVVAGVGNIYADESLFLAGLHPSRLAHQTTADERDRLRSAIVTVLEKAITHRGSTIRNYVGGSGLRGEFQRELEAYGRTGQPCSRCGTPIEQLRLAGRSTHFCPSCQVGGRTVRRR